MTLLVGITARDGIILAADKRAVSFSQTEDEFDDTMGPARSLSQVLTASLTPAPEMKSQYAPERNLFLG